MRLCRASHASLAVALDEMGSHVRGVQLEYRRGTHPGHAVQLLELLRAEAGQDALLQLLLAVDVRPGHLLLAGRLTLLRHVVLPQLLQELVLYA